MRGEDGVGGEEVCVVLCVCRVDLVDGSVGVEIGVLMACREEARGDGFGYDEFCVNEYPEEVDEDGFVQGLFKVWKEGGGGRSVRISGGVRWILMVRFKCWNRGRTSRC